MNQPDSWSELATALRQAADSLEALAGSDLKPLMSANLFLCASYTASQASLTMPVVDAIAAAFGAKARTKIEGRGADRRGEHRFSTNLGPMYLSAYAKVPAPPTRTAKLAELQRENDELRAALAAQGGEQA